MDDLRLNAAAESAAETERALRFFLSGGSNSPREVTCAWRAYRGAVNLRKSLEQMADLRRFGQADNHTSAVEARE